MFITYKNSLDNFLRQIRASNEMKRKRCGLFRKTAEISNAY